MAMPLGSEDDWNPDDPYLSGRDDARSVVSFDSYGSGAPWAGDGSPGHERPSPSVQLSADAPRPKSFAYAPHAWKNSEVWLPGKEALRRVTYTDGECDGREVEYFVGANGGISCLNVPMYHLEVGTSCLGAMRTSPLDFASTTHKKTTNSIRGTNALLACLSEHSTFENTDPLSMATSGAGQDRPEANIARDKSQVDESGAPVSDRPKKKVPKR